MTSIVYTAIRGGYDKLRRQPPTGDRFLAFLDDPPPERMGDWELATIADEVPRDARLGARWLKIMAHRALPDCEYSLWIDGTVLMAQPRSLRELAREFLAEADIASFRHYARDCIYAEAWHCLKLDLDDRERIYAQVAAYTADGHPQNFGLVETPVILRRHTKAVERLNESWWGEVSSRSVRDQISFNYVARKLGVPYAVFPGSILRNPLFVKHRHLQERPAPRATADSRSHGAR